MLKYNKFVKSQGTTTDNSEHEILLILSVDWEDPTESGQMLFSAQSDPAIQKITEQFRKEVQFLEKLHPQPEPKQSESEPESKDTAEAAK